jgi:hypothetical protein
VDLTAGRLPAQDAAYPVDVLHRAANCQELIAHMFLSRRPIARARPGSSSRPRTVLRRTEVRRVVQQDARLAVFDLVRDATDKAHLISEAERAPPAQAARHSSLVTVRPGSELRELLLHLSGVSLSPLS